MPVANPIVEGIPGRGPVAAAEPEPDAPAPAPAMSIGGMGGFPDLDNVSVHCAVLVAAALGIVLFLHWGGFRFAVDAGVTRP
jgi:hypothetical protein